jgi:hypothetical protein
MIDKYIEKSRKERNKFNKVRKNINELIDFNIKKFLDTEVKKEKKDRKVEEQKSNREMEFSDKKCKNED